MHFLHLGIYFEDSQAPDREAIETVLNKAKDWFRYAPNCWIIYTSLDAKAWYGRLRELPGMKPHASFLIFEINEKDRAGWVKTSFWDWLKKDRD